MLLGLPMIGSAVFAPIMASTEEDRNIYEFDLEITDSNAIKDTSNLKPRKTSEAFEIDFGESMSLKFNKNLQESFKKFRKQRQNEIKQSRIVQNVGLEWRADPDRMETLRAKFVERAKHYFGVPYAKKYWSKDSPEYSSPLFLDCCGLVRQVMRDLEEDFGFRLGPWNQAYMYDTLPISRQVHEMRSGDLVFMKGTYVNPKSKKQRHSMTHVEIWLGEGEKTIGARWNNGKVKVFDSYKFTPKSFTNEKYFFRSIDTWLMGICKSFCHKHKWGTSLSTPGTKSIFFVDQNLSVEDEMAGDEDSDNVSDLKQSLITLRDSLNSNSNSNSTTNPDVKLKQSDAEDADTIGQHTILFQQEHVKRKRHKRRKKTKKVTQNDFLPQSTRRALRVLEDKIDSRMTQSYKELEYAKQRHHVVSSPKGVRQKSQMHLSLAAKGKNYDSTACRLRQSTSTASPRRSGRVRQRHQATGGVNTQLEVNIPSVMPKPHSFHLVGERSILLYPNQDTPLISTPHITILYECRPASDREARDPHTSLTIVSTGQMPKFQKKSYGDLKDASSGHKSKKISSGHNPPQPPASDVVGNADKCKSTLPVDFGETEVKDFLVTQNLVVVHDTDEDDRILEICKPDTDIEYSEECDYFQGQGASGLVSNDWNEDIDTDIELEFSKYWQLEREARSPDICFASNGSSSRSSPRKWSYSEYHTFAPTPILGSSMKSLEKLPGAPPLFSLLRRLSVDDWQECEYFENSSMLSSNTCMAATSQPQYDETVVCSRGQQQRERSVLESGQKSCSPRSLNLWSASEPNDGDLRNTESGNSGAIGEPSESDQAGGDQDAGADGTGDGSGAGRSGRRGGKKTPGGRPTKLPACSLPSNMTPTFYIGGGNGCSLVEAPLLALGWKRITDKYDERFRLKWVECKSKINYQTFKEGDQIVNHIPNCKLLTNKMGLLCSLQEYERVTFSTKGRLPRLKMSEFVPETYKLDERNDRAAFLEIYKEGEIWICKPVGMNQGKGIFLLRSREEIDNLLSERDTKKETSKVSSRQPMSRIVQRYITNPLLIDGRKFDIRAYMLIASMVPYLVLFHHGYIRLSCLKYDGNDTNLTTHLTNQYVQKKDPSYKDVKEDTAWSMAKFNDYINREIAPTKGLEENWTFNAMTKQMQRIVLHCFNSVKHKLQCKIGYFDLYGLDFMIDTDMKIWLIEINVNPALNINCEALKEVIPGVVEETLQLSIECFEKSRKNQPLMPLQSLKGFQILHCGTQPYTVALRQARSVSPVKGDNPERNRLPQTAHMRQYSPPRSLPRMSLTMTQVSPYQSSQYGGGQRSSQLPVIQQSSSQQNTTATEFSTSTSKDVSAGGDDIKAKLTLTNASKVRKSRERSDRGN